MIIEHKGKQFNLINPLRFDEVEAVFRHTRKYIEITERMRLVTTQTEYEVLHSEHVKALDDQNHMKRLVFKRCLGLSDATVDKMDYGEASYLFNKILEMTVILAR